MNQILTIFENIILNKLKGEYPEIEWNVIWTERRTQVNIRGIKGAFLKKEVGKGDVYRFRSNYGFTPEEENELFLYILSHFSEIVKDIVLEFHGNLYSTGENSKIVAQLFSDLTAHSKCPIQNQLGSFSFTGLSFVRYKYNIKLSLESKSLIIISSFKNLEGRNLKQELMHLSSLEDVLSWVKNYEDERKTIAEKLGELNEFVRSLDPNGEVNVKYRSNVLLLKKNYTYSFTKTLDNPGYIAHVYRGYAHIGEISTDSIEELFEAVKNHITTLFNKDRLLAIMESRI